MNLRVVVALVLGLTALTAGGQQIYRWTDEKGRVHVTDTPPPSSARKVERKGSATARGSSAAQASTPTPFELAQAIKNFPVTLYTSPTCSEPCANARSVLNQRGVPFNEVQVWDEQTNADLKQVSGNNEVPTLVVGRSVHVGFQHSAYDALLDSARYPKVGAVAARTQPVPAPPEGYTPPPVAKPVEPEAPAPTGPYSPRPAPPAQR
jgi:glutaredoxin